ncbi:MAG: fumarylacetoacetate hydrolase family protein [Rhodothermaceae bacterium]|nr:fumarylacetoacetate hydrolase family protein [Rhodothermaceae bacterium]
MIVYKTAEGIVVHQEANWYLMDYIGWDELASMESMYAFLIDRIKQSIPEDEEPDLSHLLPPLGTQEVWAAGVTYFRSRTARMEESSSSGGSDFYDRVYHADRPELFLKTTAHRVKAHRESLSLRKDSSWMVPEPELTLLISPKGRVQGYTIGNDLSCRDIEGENPLYLPQAKTFDGCAAIGPGVWVTDEPISENTEISSTIVRSGKTVSEGTTQVSQIKKKLTDLVDYLFHSCSFPVGTYLMTGTGIVPADDFTLEPGDEIQITIEPIGTLINTVE